MTNALETVGRSLMGGTSLSEKPILKNIFYCSGASNYMGPMGWHNDDPRSEVFVWHCPPPIWLRWEDLVMIPMCGNSGMVGA